MTETKTKDEKKAAPVFDLADIQLEDSGEMSVLDPRTGEETAWKIKWAGPTHPATIKHKNRAMRKGFKQLRKSARQLEDERDDGKDDMAESVVELLVARCLGWTPVTSNGESYEFSEENARKLFLGNPLIRAQGLNYLNDDANFLQKSARS